MMDVKIVNVKAVVAEYLEKHKFDGLWSDECASKLDDLMPCGDGWDIAECRPGHEMPCPENCGEHDFHIGGKQEKA